MNKIFTITLLLLFLSGCATPPGKLDDSDFVIKKYTINIPIQDAVRNFYSGLRYCGPYSGGILGLGVTHHGIPECAPTKKNGTVVCDLYVGGADGGRTGVVLGRVNFKPYKTTTSVELRVQSYAAGTDDILNAWKLFIANRAVNVCPKE